MLSLAKRDSTVVTFHAAGRQLQAADDWKVCLFWLVWVLCSCQQDIFVIKCHTLCFAVFDVSVHYGFQTLNFSTAGLDWKCPGDGQTDTLASILFSITTITDVHAVSMTAGNDQYDSDSPTFHFQHEAQSLRSYWVTKPIYNLVHLLTAPPPEGL